MLQHNGLRAFAFVCLAVGIVACDGATPTPGASTIEVVVADVARAVAGGNWVVVSPGTAQPLNDGDRVGTSPQGEGLIKLACAWLRLYRDSLLQVKSVSVSGVDLTAMDGAGLVNTGCARIVVNNGVSPPEAVIETHGTLFFFAYNSPRRIVLLWTLDGTAGLTNLRSNGTFDVSVVVPAGYWSVVRSAGAPAPIRPTSEIAPIIDEMNLRDVYAKVIELVKPEIPTAAAAPEWTRSPTATVSPSHTPTTTPTPTLTLTLTRTRTGTPTLTRTTVPQGTLGGRVTSVAKGVSGAPVTIMPCSGDVCFTSGARSVSTNSSGYYTFPNVASGTYSVSVSASGYAKQTKTAFVSGGQTTTIDFALIKSSTASGTDVVLVSYYCFDFDQGERLYNAPDPPYNCATRADIQWNGTMLKPVNGAGMGYPNLQTNSYEACENSSVLLGGVNPVMGKYYCVFTQQDKTAVIRIDAVKTYPAYSVTFDWWRY